ncbi:hypothetical protein C4577_05600 [Candidatus Parcubacteria bacterium]|nr:MAG: hypothetical protein C4577_05600 [Candidatus Parcubacteria bacterium]
MKENGRNPGLIEYLKIDYPYVNNIIQLGRIAANLGDMPEAAGEMRGSFRELNAGMFEVTVSAGSYSSRIHLFKRDPAKMFE